MESGSIYISFSCTESGLKLFFLNQLLLLNFVFQWCAEKCVNICIDLDWDLKNKP